MKEFFDKNAIARYIVAGGSASLLDIVLFSVFLHLAGMHYLVSVAVSNSIAFFFRFFIQKIFAFRDRSVSRLPFQLLYYSLLYAGGLMATVFLMYVFVEALRIPHNIAQLMAIALVALGSYFVYKRVIFPEHENEKAEE